LAALALAPLSPPAERLQAVISGKHRGHADIPSLGAGVLQKAAEASLRAYFQAQLADFRKMGRETLDGYEGARPPGFITYDGGSVISINRPDGVSLYASAYFDYLGAHPNRTYRTMVWANVDGRPRQLKSADILRGPVMETARDFLIPRLEQMDAGMFALEEDGRLSTHVPEPFLPTPAGISWVFEPYAVDAYARGDVILKASWGEVSPVLRTDAPLTAFAGHAAGKVQLMQRIMLPEGTTAVIRVVRADGQEISKTSMPFRGGIADFSLWYPKLNQPAGAEMTLKVDVLGRYSAEQKLSPSRLDRRLELTLRG
jgi:hypothetical protein